MKQPVTHVSTTNACKLCSPLGASLVFRGVEGGVPFIHGSQGCSTYIRRYIISHFNEPIDIASSSFAEASAVFGGDSNLKLGLKNVSDKYLPKMIGVATSCLTETIGDDVPLILRKYAESAPGDIPHLIPVSTPSYAGTHMDGFHAAVKALVVHLASSPQPNSLVPAESKECNDIPLYHGGIEEGESTSRDWLQTPKTLQVHDVDRLSEQINIFPGFISSADIRHIKEILTDFEQPYAILPDYSETLDGAAQREYIKIPNGGTPIASIINMGSAKATIQFSTTLPHIKSAGGYLLDTFEIPAYNIGMPIGVNRTDAFFDTLLELAGREDLPDKYLQERGRLIDSYVDGHKYIFGKRAVIYGEEDLVVGLASFLVEIGIIPVLCATGGKSGHFTEAVQSVAPDMPKEAIKEGVDFYEIEEDAKTLSPDILIGNSKGYAMSRRMGVPLVRVGFPIHDRLGGQRLLHVGYRGAQRLFDEVVNTLIAVKQDSSPVGYSYM